MYHILRFYRTIYYLKFTQIIFQILYRIGLRIPFQILTLKTEEIKGLKEFSFVSNNLIARDYLEFSFLNKSISFKKDIDWNFEDFGKLWNYNLSYFDFINSKKYSEEEKEKILGSFSKNNKNLKYGKDPYPTSLRIINLIKLRSREKLPFCDQILIQDISRLYSSLEYNILGNHLLENAFALYFAAHLFPENKKLINQAIKLLKEQLNEQFLQDGAHYERSFMYHKIILGRLLESISLSTSNSFIWNKELLTFLVGKAQLMIQWMKKISNDGENFIRFNDSVEGIAPGYEELIKLASGLVPDIENEIELNDSGFRVWHLDNFFIVMNIGEITPKYQPGHSHADTLSFTVHYKGDPLIVDPGISTYENNTQRRLERSTSYHNTVSINGENNNEVWSAFRVGRRAKVTLLKDSNNYLEAEHNGYSFLKATHRRRWEIKDSKILISDYLSTPEENTCELNIHLHPEVEIRTINNGKYLLNNDLIISFDPPSKIELESYEYCEGFNKKISSKRINVLFNQRLTTEIFYENSFDNG